MPQIRWYYHPLFIFILSLVALGFSLFLYLHWYLKVSEAFLLYLSRYHQGPEQFLETKTWVIVLVMSLLMGLILVGMIMIYLFYQKMKELYRMQQNFINGFTHELKTPLASLQIFLETFSKYHLSFEEQKKYVDYMLRDTKRINDNVDRILKMAKIEEKKYQPEKKMCDVAEVLDHYLQQHTDLLKNITIKKDILKKRYYIYFDPELFEIVVANLINNAISYKSEKNLEIKIEIEEKGKFIHIIFTDNGRGLLKENFKKIFKKFYQVEKNSKGTGIGLFLVGLILKLHRASIQVHSQGLGKGSSFLLKIPHNLALIKQKANL